MSLHLFFIEHLVVGGQSNELMTVAVPVLVEQALLEH